MGECGGGDVSHCGQHCSGQPLGHRQGKQVDELREAQQSDEVSIRLYTFLLISVSMVPLNFLDITTR